MKKICSGLLFIIVSFVIFIDSAQAAFTQADLAGNWYASVLSTGSGEVSEKADMVIDSLGNFTYTWVESGEASDTDTGNLILSSKGKITNSTDTSLQGAMNISKDIFVFTLAWEPGTYALHIFSRVGSGLTTSDLQGIWYDFSLTTGSNEYWDTGTTTFDNEGNQSYTWNNSLGDSGSGTNVIAISSNGIATSENDQPMDFSRTVISSGKNLGFGVDISQRLSAHLKSGASYVLEDLEGTWYVYDIISGSGEHILNEILTINAQGDYSSLWTSSSGDSGTITGTLNLSNIGVISTITGPTFQGFLSSDKDFAVGISTSGPGEYVFTTLFKADTAMAVNNPPTPPTALSPGNGSTNLSLTPILTTNTFTDSDIGDTHSQTDWEISTSYSFSSTLLQVQSQTNLTTFTVPDMTLQEGITYYWKARFYDNNANESDWSEPFSFTTRVTQNDTDANGIPDALENTTVDLDADGTADIEQVDEIKTLNTVVGSGQMGASIKESATITTITEVNSIDPDTISEIARPESMPLGLFSLRATVANPGDSGNVTIYFSEAAPSNAIWYFYDSINGWTDYSQYATFSSDRKSVNVQLKDGGHGDSDGIANGIIVDPSGFGIASWIKGVVSDSSTGQTISTATLNFEGIELSLNSLLDGNFLSMILPGTYDFTVSAPNYTSQTLSNVAISEGAIVTKDIVLSSKVTQTQVAELYVATFNRAPDTAGLNYWVSCSLSIEQIAKSFFDQSETKSLYPAGNTDAQFVTSIYQNLFNRAPDAAGLDYWVGPLGLGSGLARSVMIEALKNGATGTDRAIINNKTEAGLYCANHCSQAVEFSLSDITDDPTTLENAKKEMDNL